MIDKKYWKSFITLSALKNYRNNYIIKFAFVISNFSAEKHKTQKNIWHQKSIKQKLTWLIIFSAKNNSTHISYIIKGMLQELRPTF